MTQEIVLSLVLVLILALSSKWLSARIQIPSVLLLLIAGYLAGPITNILVPDRLLGNLFDPLVQIAVSLVLFESGLRFDLKIFHDSDAKILKLLAIVAVLTCMFCSLLAWKLLIFPIGLSIFCGTLLLISGPNVINPFLLYIRPNKKIRSILKREAVLIEPIGVIVALIAYFCLKNASIKSVSQWNIFQNVMMDIGAGVSIGLITAGLLVFFLNYIQPPGNLRKPLLYTIPIAVFGWSGFFQENSGYLAVLIMGMGISNLSFMKKLMIDKSSISRSNIPVSCVFILMAASVSMNELNKIDSGYFLFLMAITIFVRPVSIFIGFLKSGSTIQEKIFLSMLAPRGMIAGALVFGLALNLEKNYPAAKELVSIVFFVIAGTIAIDGLLSTPLANALRFVYKVGNKY